MNLPEHLARQASQVPDEFHQWDQNRAMALAREEQIELTTAHWAVIHFLRRRCREQGIDRNAGVTIRALAERFAIQGGKAYLYSLFPRGPVMQGCRIAGVPLPPHTTDQSFGSSH